jgi:hypothetical protein
MLNLFKKKTDFDARIKRVEQATTLNRNAGNQDRDKDGISDFLQREAMPSLLKDIKDTTLAHADTAKELEKLKMYWRGYEYDPTESMYRPIAIPMISEQGIMEISSVLDPIINKHTMNGNFNDIWAHLQCKRLTIKVAKLIRDKRIKFKISIATRDSLIETIDAFIFNVYSRAIGDGQRSHDDKRLSLHGNNNPDAPQSKQAI